MTDHELAIYFWIVVGLGTFVVLVTLGILAHDWIDDYRIRRRPHRTAINDRLQRLPK